MTAISGRPILLSKETGVFEESDDEIFIEKLMEARLVLTRDYYQDYRETGYFNSRSRTPSKSATIGEWLRGGDCKLDAGQSIEGPVPKIVSQKIQKSLRLDFPCQQGLASLLFAAKKGFQTEPHFDGDYRDVCIVHLIGAKTYKFASSIPFVNIRSVFNYGTCQFQDFQSRKAFVVYEIRAEAGDILLFPGYLWHTARYEEDSVSVSVRFGSCATSRFLAEFFHKDFNSRIVIEALRNSAPCFDRQRFQKCLVQTLFNDALSPSDKLADVETLFFEAASSVNGAIAVEPKTFRSPCYEQTKLALLSNGLYSHLP